MRINGGAIFTLASALRAKRVLPHVALLTAVSTALPAWADLSTKTASQGGITIPIKTDTDGPVVNYNLGSFDVSLQDYTTTSGVNSSKMNVSFEVDQTPGGLPDGIFDHIALHWYQQVVSLAPAARFTYGGITKNVNPNLLPITDPPSGGWDYMYQNPVKRINPYPNFVPFIDDAPFYYTTETETNFSEADTGKPLVTVGVEYNMGDIPSDQNDPGGKGDDVFTYLVAQVLDLDSHDPLALKFGQFMVLGGFEWHAESSDIGIDQTFAGSPSGAVDSINLAMLHGGFPTWDPNNFSSWGAVDNAVIVTAPDPVPEPGTLALLSGVLFVAARRRSRC